MLLKNSRIFKFLYYLNFILVVGLFVVYTVYMVSEYDLFYKEILTKGYGGEGSIHLILLYVNIFFVFLISFFLILKKEIKNVNILFPCIFICFLLVLSVVSVLFNNKLMAPDYQHEYYMIFIYGGYLFLNIYTLLSIEWKKTKVLQEKVYVQPFIQEQTSAVSTNMDHISMV